MLHTYKELPDSLKKKTVSKSRKERPTTHTLNFLQLIDSVPVENYISELIRHAIPKGVPLHYFEYHELSLCGKCPQIDFVILSDTWIYRNDWAAPVEVRHRFPNVKIIFLSEIIRLTSPIKKWYINPDIYIYLNTDPTHFAKQLSEFVQESITLQSSTHP